MKLFIYVMKEALNLRLITTTSLAQYSLVTSKEQHCFSFWDFLCTTIDVIPIAKKRKILDLLRNQLELDNS